MNHGGLNSKQIFGQAVMIISKQNGFEKDNESKVGIQKNTEEEEIYKQEKDSAVAI